jgi:hypothetical protein
MPGFPTGRNIPKYGNESYLGQTKTLAQARVRKEPGI